MSEKAALYRRPVLTALSILILVIALEVLYLYSNRLTPKFEFITNNGASAPAIKTSQLHYLMPATSENELFCAVIASALVNRYPVPFIIGWKGQGKFNATAAHIAKLHAMKRYLNTLPHGGDPDDLVIFGDGHDVMAQLPADVIVERYFQVAAEADRRLADRFGISVEEAHERGLRQTLFWGADKMCWPPLHNEPQCAAIPESPLPHNTFGSKSDNGDFVYSHARFLNSGSVIGRLDDLRKFIDAGVAEVERTFDPKSKHKFSDQVYLSRLFARQEISRTERLREEAFPKLDRNLTTPQFEEEGAQNTTEYHVAIDYASDFVQTGCYSHKWMQKLRYNNSDNTATMHLDRFDHGSHFKPYSIQMPANVYQSFLRVFDSLPDHLLSVTGRDWIESLELDTNIVSSSIFGFYHATCGKRVLINDFKSYWFYPLIKPLLRASFQATQAGQLISSKLIDGRRWEYKVSYPEEGVSEEQLGGVFTDFKNQTYIPFTTLCAKHLDILGL
ncbi:hypothetical protein BGZ63DRAFT_377601 [Mariannaea sp. PMI_226]|nr:hypothetical protein BGZ63DRAFT_377601 [Mariannaea sp. PMI_226]